jgi:hypothetical protein
MAARTDADQWKRRTGLLQLRLSSAQEDADMYAMRCRLLQAEIGRETALREDAQVCGVQPMHACAGVYFSVCYKCMTTLILA